MKIMVFQLLSFTCNPVVLLSLSVIPAVLLADSKKLGFRRNVSHSHLCSTDFFLEGREDTILQVPERFLLYRFPQSS